MTRDTDSPTENQPLAEDQGRTEVLRRASYRTPFLLLLPLALLLLYLRDKVKSFENKAAAFAAEARAVPVPPVMWFAPFFSGGGYCSEAISFLQALNQRGVPVRIEQHGDSYSASFVQGLPTHLRQLLSEASSGGPAAAAAGGGVPSQAVVVCHSEPGAWHPPNYHTSRCPPRGAWYRVGRTMFETDRLPQGWPQRLNHMDEVWVPSSFQRDVFLAAGVSASKLFLLPEAVDTDFFSPDSPLPPYRLPLSEEEGGQQQPPFVFLSVFKWEERKGWDVLLRAYLNEFFTTSAAAEGGDDQPPVLLVLLTNAYHDTSDFDAKISRFVADEQRAGRLPAGLQWPHHCPQIQVLSGLSGEELAGLYKTAHVLVQPSRGEGWGRPHVEAMASATPVIATNWSGPTEFLREENGYPLAFEGLTPVTSGAFKGHLWAAPSQSHLQQLMRHAVNHPQEVRAKGVAARRAMEQLFSPHAVGQVLIQHLTRIADQKQRQQEQEDGGRTEL